MHYHYVFGILLIYRLQPPTCVVQPTVASIDSHSTSCEPSSTEALINSSHSSKDRNDASSKRSAMAVKSFNFDSTWSNITVYNAVCNALDATVDTLTLNSTEMGSMYYTLPACVTNSLILKNLTIDGQFILPNRFAALPRHLETLFIRRARFSHGPMLDDGFNESGQLDWDEVFSLLPSISSLTLNGNLPGPLPEALPWQMVKFSLDSVGLFGTIPSTLFILLNSSSLEFSVSNNSISGNIPSSLFSAMAPRPMQSFIFNIGRNRLSGSLPPDLLQPLTGLHDFIFDASHNELSGPLPTTLLRSNFMAASVYGDFALILSSNRLTGSISSSAFPQAPVNRLTFKADSNLLSGSLPTYVGKPWSSFTLNLTNNELSGTFPPRLFIDNISYNLKHFSFLARSNRLNGSIARPDSGFLTNMPSALMTQIDVANNQLTGSVLQACITSGEYHLDMSHNQLSGSIMQEWNDCRVSSMNVASNPALTGPLPASLFGQTWLTSFKAARTGISGSIPTITPALTMLDLSYTNNVIFCSAQSRNAMAHWSAATASTCSFICTTASSCSSSYYMCNTACPPPPVAPAPVVPPPMPIVPSSEPSSSSSCPSSTRPSPDFYCVNGQWYAPATVNVTTLVVPSGAGTVIVNNISSSTIIFHDFTSKITIHGCTTNLTSIVIELSESDAKKLGKSPKELKRLLTLGSMSAANSSCSNFDKVKIITSVKGGGCSKVSASKSVVDEGSTLGAYFIVDSSGCNRWWIILVSIVSAVVVLSAIAAIVSYSIWKNRIEKKHLAALAKSASD